MLLAFGIAGQVFNFVCFGVGGVMAAIARVMSLLEHEGVVVTIIHEKQWKFI